MPIILPKSVFVHIPKTGGTWVTAVLKKMDLVQNIVAPHEPTTNFKSLIGNRTYFTFIRNPVTWYQSRWSGQYARDHYPKKLKNQGNFSFQNDAELTDFRLWLKNVLKRGTATELFNQYINECDLIGKNETLTTDLENFLSQIGETFKKKPLKTKHINTGVELDRWYTKPLLKKVIELDGEFMEKFNYSTNWRHYEHLILQ